jgi:hypothetical protein
MRKVLSELKPSPVVIAFVVVAVVVYAFAANAYQRRFDTVLKSINEVVSEYCFAVEEALVTKQGYSWPSSPCDRSGEPFSSEYVNFLVEANR